MASVSVILKQILNKKGVDAIVNDAKAQLTPAPKLLNAYGPLTDKLTQEKTLFTAKYLFERYIAEPANQDTQLERPAFRTALVKVRNALATSSVKATNNTVVLLWDATKIDQAIEDAAKITIAKVKSSYTHSQPEILQIADVAVAITVSGTPFVGPALSGFIIGGPNVALSYEVGAMGAYFQPEINSLYPQPDMGSKEAQSSYSKAMGMQKDPGKDGMKDAALSKKLADKTTGKLGNDNLLLSKPSSFGIGLLWYGFMRMKLGMTDSAITEAAKNPQAITHSIVTTSRTNATSNPITRNQLAINTRLEYVIKAPAQVGQKVNELIQSNSKTLEEFKKKIKDSHVALREVFEQIINMGVAQSFYPELDSWKKRLNAEFSGKGSTSYELGASFDQNHINVVALLVFSYFYYQEMKSRKNEHYQSYINNLMKDTRPKGISMLDKSFESRHAATQANLAALASNPTIQAFQSLRSYTDNETLIWPSVESKACEYIALVKNALIEDLGQPFKSNGDTKKMTLALGLYFTCVIIVTDNVSRKAAGEQANKFKSVFMTTKTDFPDEAISFLSTNGFLTKYTTTFGKVDDADKLKFTANGKKLRYYGGIKGASKSEKTMVYLFSLMVMIIVDPVAIVTGYQDWDRTRDLLEKVIEEINKAEKSLDE